MFYEKCSYVASREDVLKNGRFEGRCGTLKGKNSDCIDKMGLLKSTYGM